MIKNETGIIRIFSNPFYCLRQVETSFCVDHETMVSEEEFIKAGVKLIEEIGAEAYIKAILDNLKGDFVK